MKAVTWHGKQDVRVDNVPDPTIQEPNDAIVRITTTNICGSDLHLYNVLGPFIDEGDILGQENLPRIYPKQFILKGGEVLGLRYTEIPGRDIHVGQAIPTRILWIRWRKGKQEIVVIRLKIL